MFSHTRKDFGEWTSALEEFNLSGAFFVFLGGDYMQARIAEYSTA